MTNLKLTPALIAAGLLFSSLAVPAQAERIPLAAHRAIYELALDPQQEFDAGRYGARDGSPSK